MSERYVIKDRWIFDTKLNKNIHSIDCYEEKNVLDIMNGQDQRIAELEEQLKNAIVPKFKSRDVAYRINCFTKDIEQVVIVNTHIEIICGINITYTIACLGETQTLANIDIRNIIEDFGTYITQEREEDLFSTKEKAQAKLKELQGESDVKD